MIAFVNDTASICTQPINPMECSKKAVKKFFKINLKKGLTFRELLDIMIKH